MSTSETGEGEIDTKPSGKATATTAEAAVDRAGTLKRMDGAKWAELFATLSGDSLCFVFADGGDKLTLQLEHAELIRKLDPREAEETEVHDMALDRAFRIKMKESHGGTEHVLVAPSSADRQLWLDELGRAALVSPTQTEALLSKLKHWCDGRWLNH